MRSVSFCTVTSPPLAAVTGEWQMMTRDDNVKLSNWCVTESIVSAIQTRQLCLSGNLKLSPVLIRLFNQMFNVSHKLRRSPLRTGYLCLTIHRTTDYRRHIWFYRSFYRTTCTCYFFIFDSVSSASRQGASNSDALLLLLLHCYVYRPVNTTGNFVTVSGRACRQPVHQLRCVLRARLSVVDVISLDGRKFWQNCCLAR